MQIPKRSKWALGKYARGPYQGELKITRYSSLRKLARAIRRKRIPDERQFIIDEAMKNAQRRQGVYRRTGNPR